MSGIWRPKPSSKESACLCRSLCSIPGSGRSPGEGNGNSHQYSCLENSMDRGDWRALECMELQRVRHDLATKQQQAALVERPVLLQGQLEDEYLSGTVLMALSFPWCYSALQSTPAHCCIHANTFQLIYKHLSFNILLFWDQDDFETSVVFHQ